MTPGDSDGWYRAAYRPRRGSRRSRQRCDRAGHGVSVAQAYLRAANYRYAGFWYALAMGHSARPGPTCGGPTAGASTPPSTAGPPRPSGSPFRGARASIPKRIWRPGCSRRLDRVGLPARLLVVQGGLGSPLSDSLMTGVVDAVDRGWHAVAFDGPGQGRARVEDGLGPVDDWGTVVTAVLDVVCARPALTDAVVALLGVADGGNLVIRAAATELRVAAVVCDPGVVRPVDGVLVAVARCSRRRVAWG